MTSQVAGALRCPFLHRVHLFRFSQASFGKRKTVGRGVAVHHSACHPAHWQQRRMKCEEPMSLGQLHGAREWKGELETLGCEIAVERRTPLLLPAGNSCWPALPGDAVLETCRTKEGIFLCMVVQFSIVLCCMMTKHLYMTLQINLLQDSILCRDLAVLMMCECFLVTYMWWSLCWVKSRSWTSLPSGSAWLSGLLREDSLVF